MKIFPEAVEEEKYENPFAPFIGMFSSGKTDTSTRYKEILKEEIDKRRWIWRKLMAYLLDTGFWYASLDNSDEHHEKVAPIASPHS
ncbi:MAG: hypothetical protein WKF71_13875 [Pyrinomonadaceae bacterium]